MHFCQGTQDDLKKCFWNIYSVVSSQSLLSKFVFVLLLILLRQFILMLWVCLVGKKVFIALYFYYLCCGRHLIRKLQHKCTVYMYRNHTQMLQSVIAIHTRCICYQSHTHKYTCSHFRLCMCWCSLPLFKQGEKG